MTESRSSRRQALLWHIEAWLYDFARFLARLFPIDTVSDFGGRLARRMGPLTSYHRVAETNLRIVFPKASELEIKRLLGEQWEEVGRSLAEFQILDRIVAEPERVEIEGIERLIALRDGHPAVLISGHFSNFEIMALAIMRAGVECQVTYRATNNPYINERIVAGRRAYGVKLFAPKGAQGTRGLFRTLARGECISIMIDQKFNTGVAAPFFGVMAHTAPGASTFALKFGIPMVPMSVQRTHKVRFKVIVHEPIRLADTGDREADIVTAVHRINAFMEERVLARPSEWFWVHKRWPNEIYKHAA
ncbi:lysophospholipid acyltransferase family protein [Phenylobacterium sp.]|uniref:lysophospholipid acyltransferase family protein n=1 Tax=Phenylobacterium sp. TaxID=1871053 RepID=UPI00120A9FBF|nr:lysophospholipid acyltransferase family protein [Phenylobacterium sp.]THD59265.1 MAG: lipid A biosynthesis acyltransferase [Phenylobacterium sp.]